MTTADRVRANGDEKLLQNAIEVVRDARERAPADFTDGAAVARYGALVRGRVGGWFDGAGDSEFARDANTYYGPQPAHEFLERTTWHCAQHLRQLHVLFDRLGLRAPAPLDETLLDRLPLPESIW